MIKNVVFDIGNVLVDFRWYDYLIEDMGFSKEMAERIGKAAVNHPSWNEFDRGVLSDQEIVQLFVDNDPEIEKELHKAFDSLKGIVRERVQAVPWVKGIHDAGFNTFYLSNYSNRVKTDCPEALAFLNYMDGGIFSYDVKLIKPDRAIYAELTSKYGLAPEECLFVDDRAENVQAALECGWNAIVFEEYKKTFEEMQALGVTTQYMEGYLADGN